MDTVARLTPFKLERYFAQYEFTARYLLCSSDCESITIGELLDYEHGAREALERHWLGYTESRGSPELRAEIAKLYTHVQPDHLLVHAGAEEGIFAFMFGVLAPGDHVIVHAPGYQSLHEVARAAGCEVSQWTTREADGWALDIDWLSDHLRPNTRAIVVNCPHNPTGYLMSADTQQQIVRLAAAHNLILFSDEVYRGTEQNPAERLPAACDLYENAVSLGVLSKTYGLPGLRIGWIATRNRTLSDQIATVKDYLTICNSAPSEFLATLAVRHLDHITVRNMAIIDGNLDLLDAFFARHADLFRWRRPRAGSTAFPALTRDVGAFCHDLVESTGVLLLPGMVYDYPGDYFRVGFGRKNMPEALGVLESYLTGG